MRIFLRFGERNFFDSGEEREILKENYGIIRILDFWMFRKSGFFVLMVEVIYVWLKGNFKLI